MKAAEAAKLHARTRDIEGWFSFEAAMLFAWIDDIQRSNDVRGHLFEIGVHHGKSAVLLAAMAGEGEHLGVCDLFETQGDNLSGSGLGDREIFESNIRTLLPTAPEIQVFAQRSDKLDAELLGGGYRFFHVDGGHNPDEALTDLRLAAAVLDERGVIVVDDPLTPVWPGVAEALFRFLEENQGYCAVATGFNKMVLARRQHADLYRIPLDDPQQCIECRIVYPWKLKTLAFMGEPLRIFFVPSHISISSLRTRLKRAYLLSDRLRSPAFKPLASLGRVLLRE